MNFPLDMRLVSRNAVLSPDGRYRYRLERRWRPEGEPLVFLMLNPSTADADKDDPTVRKCCGFAARAGYPAIAIVNLFAIRATNPAELIGKPHLLIKGPENDKYLAAQFDDRDVVFGWGRHGEELGGAWLMTVQQMAQRHARSIGYLKMLPGNVPAHPLHLSYENTIKPWRL